MRETCCWAGSENEQSVTHLPSWGGQPSRGTDLHQIQLAPARRPLAIVQVGPCTLFSGEGWILPIAHQTHQALLLPHSWWLQGRYSQPPFPVPSLPGEAACPIRYTWNKTAQCLHFLLATHWSSIKLSFVMVMLYLARYLSRSPAVRMKLLFYFRFLLSTGFVRKAQDRPEPKHTF